MPGKLSGEIVWLSRFFQSKYKPYELLGGMRDCDVIVLALGAFLGKIGSKGFIPMADKLSGVENGVSQVSGTPLLHARVG